MAGSPQDLRIPSRNEPPPDEKAKKEQRQTASGNLDDGRKKTLVLKNLWKITLANHMILFGIVILEGFEVIGFNLDSWVLVSLITGVLGSTTVHFLKRSADFAYSKSD